MELTDEMIALANQRGAEARNRNPVATSVRYDRRIGRVVIALSSGLELAFAPHLAQGLEAAKPSDLQEIEILVMRHPANRPQTVSGKKKGSTHSASEKRHCTTPKVRLNTELKRLSTA